MQKSPPFFVSGCGPGDLGGYCYPVPDCLFQLSYLLHFGVVAALGFAVEEGLAVQVDLQSAIVYGYDGYGKLALKLGEEFSRYPSGLR